MTTVVVDYRNICKIMSYSIMSGSVAMCFPTEIDEIAHRIAKRLYCIRLDYPDAKIIIANDRAPYWRSRFVNQWYSDRGKEPVPYKGNREGMPWVFASTREDLDRVYDLILTQMAAVIDAEIVEDVGLEADDIWGLLTYAVAPGETFVGISSDSDWRQCCLPGIISIHDPMTNLKHNNPLDIRPKVISGDRGDNVMGCPKVSKKTGEPTGTMWGITGAQKHVAKYGDNWDEGLDADILERNWNLIRLPCPLWDAKEARDALPYRSSISVPWEQCEITLDKYGITAGVRKLLGDRAEREAWIAKMRTQLQKENEKPPAKEKEDAEDSTNSGSADSGPAVDPPAPVPSVKEEGNLRDLGYIFEGENTRPEVTYCWGQGHIVQYQNRGDLTVCTCTICGYTWKQDKPEAEDKEQRNRNAWAKSGGTWD